MASHHVSGRLKQSEHEGLRVIRLPAMVVAMPQPTPDAFQPQPCPAPTLSRGDCVFGAAGFDHGHIYDQVRQLCAAGGTLKWVYDPQPERFKPIAALIEAQGARFASRYEDLVDDPELKLITTASVPNLRCGHGLQAMAAGKDYFTDKAPFTSLAQLAEARAAVAATGKKYLVNYSERLLCESAWHAGELIRQGAIGRVLQVLNLAPHNLAPQHRPAWFFQKAHTGGVLTDIGSHQFEQFLTYAGATGGRITQARVANFAHPEYPEFEDFGEASVILDTGASGYCRIDWFNPRGSRTWGDGRCFVLGTEGYLELRKYIDVTRDDVGDRIFLVNHDGDYEIPCRGRVGFPYFARLLHDVLHRTETAMPQEHAFMAAELALEAQAVADGEGFK